MIPHNKSRWAYAVEDVTDMWRHTAGKESHVNIVGIILLFPLLLVVLLLQLGMTFLFTRRESKPNNLEDK